MDKVANITTQGKKPSFFLEDFSEEALDKALQKGLEDLQNGRVLTSKQVRENMKRDFGV
ncbi:MAG: hypothetical protein R3Y63_15320 [Eubacteriales bacterium]